MLTNVHSISDISKERLIQDIKDIVPSFNFRINHLGIDKQLYIVLPNYKYKAIRILFELIDGIRLDTNNKVRYLKELNKFLNQRTLAIGNEYEEVLSLIYEDKSFNNFQYKSITLTDRFIETLKLYVNTVGGDIFIDTPSVIEMSVPEIASKCINPELFLSEFSKLSLTKDVCYIGDFVLYPEDMYDTDNMSLAELNEYTCGMYKDHISLMELLNSPDLTQGQRDLFSQTHCVCGGELIIRKNANGYGSLNCINFHCHNKITWALSSFIKSMNIYGIGALSLKESIVSLWAKRVRKFGKSELYYSDLLTPDFSDNFGQSLKGKYNMFLNSLTDYKGSVQNIIELCNLPYVGKYAGEFLSLGVIDKSKDFSTFLTLCNQSSIRDNRVAFSLFNYLKDIEVVLRLTKANDLSGARTCKIAITHSVLLIDTDGNVTKYKNKQDYIDMLNDYIKTNYPKSNLVIVLQHSITRETFLLIYDVGYVSSKVEKAKMNNIPVVKSNVLFQLIKENRGGFVE